LRHVTGENKDVDEIINTATIITTMPLAILGLLVLGFDDDFILAVFILHNIVLIDI
jgi:hypothetical protein